jgi:hypothetical protein
MKKKNILILFSEQSFEEYHLLFVKVNQILVLFETYQHQYQLQVLMLPINKRKKNDQQIFNNR